MTADEASYWRESQDEETILGQRFEKSPVDDARETLSRARWALISLEPDLPANLAEMTPKQAWELYCALRDIEVAEGELRAVEE